MDANLPIVDLTSTDAAQQLRGACENEGFFYLVGHGVSHDLRATIQTAA